MLFNKILFDYFCLLKLKLFFFLWENLFLNKSIIFIRILFNWFLFIFIKWFWSIQWKMITLKMKNFNQDLVWKFDYFHQKYFQLLNKWISHQIWKIIISSVFNNRIFSFIWIKIVKWVKYQINQMNKE